MSVNLEPEKRFDKSVLEQFNAASIPLAPKKIIKNILDLESLDKIFDDEDKNHFKNILKFKAFKNQEPGEYAIAWAMNGQVSNSNQSKFDVLFNDETISVKHVNFRSRHKIKFGRVGSSDQYKELMKIWCLYCFLTDDISSPTKITKEKIEMFDGNILSDLSFLISVGRDVTNFEPNFELIQLKIEHIKTKASKSFLVDCINGMIKDTVSGVNHLVLIKKNSITIKVFDNFNKKLDNFYNKHFYCLDGNEVYIRLNKT